MLVGWARPKGLASLFKRIIASPPKRRMASNPFSLPINPAVAKLKSKKRKGLAVKMATSGLRICFDKKSGIPSEDEASKEDNEARPPSH